VPSKLPDGNLRRALGEKVGIREFIRLTRRSAPWHEQVQALGIVFCIFAFFVLIVFQTLNARYSADRGLEDYGSFYASASLANLHVNPYQNHPLVFHLLGIPHYGTDTRLGAREVDLINLNPPVTLYPFRLLAHLDPTTGFFVWRLVSLGSVLRPSARSNRC
jgi:hypothetical protein